MSEYKIDPSLVAGNHQYLAGYQPRHFRWQVENNRISPRQAIRQITPLSTDNPANREPSVQLRSPQQQAQSMVQMAPPAVPMQQEPSEGLGGSLPE